MASRDPDEPITVNAPLLRALAWGANIRTDRELAERLGIAASNVSRLLRGEQAPSLRAVTAMMRLWPMVPYERLFPPAARQETPQDYGLTTEDVTEGGTEEVAEAQR